MKKRILTGDRPTQQRSLRFYLKNGYTEMSFNDPENHESDPNDVPVGKLL